MHTKHFLLGILLVAFSVSILSCDPTQNQLAKEKARTIETVKIETENLKSEILSLKSDNKLGQLKSELALVEFKLESLQKPKEFKTQNEIATELDELLLKIESLKTEINTIENIAISTK